MRQGGSQEKYNGKEFGSGYRNTIIRDRNKATSQIEQKSVGLWNGT
jgi:hypothetical protein